MSPPYFRNLLPPPLAYIPNICTDERIIYLPLLWGLHVFILSVLFTIDKSHVHIALHDAGLQAKVPVIMQL